MSGNVAIETIAYELAPERIASADIEARIVATLARLSLPQGQLEALTGIRERRFWAPGTLPSEAATLAARKVIAKADIEQLETTQAKRPAPQEI